MKYDITNPTGPAMPTLGKGTECFKLLLSQTSQDMNAPLLPMLSPLLGTRICQAEFQYPSGQWFEMCGQQAALIAHSSGNKGQFGLLVEACNRDFRQEAEEDKYREWQKVNKTEPNCKKKFYLSDLTPPVNSLVPPSRLSLDGCEQAKTMPNPTVKTLKSKKS